MRFSMLYFLCWFVVLVVQPEPQSWHVFHIRGSVENDTWGVKPRSRPMHVTRFHPRVQPFWRRLHMRRKHKKRKIGKPKAGLGLPDLDQSKATVIGSLRSHESQRGYRHAIDEFIDFRETKVE